MTLFTNRFGLVFFALLFFLVVFPALLTNSSSLPDETESFTLARENGRLASEGFRRSNNFVRAWLDYTDPQTGLIPKNLDWQEYREKYKKGGRDIWNASDNAADNYSFMVLSSAYTDQKVFTEQMMAMLDAEKKFTSRVASLPDVYSFSKHTFHYTEPDMDRIIFGASEYIKDGLLAITEWLGPNTPWFDRMITMLDDVWLYASIDTPYGKIISTNLEINGEMLQVLSRVYWITGKQKYLDWAIRLGDYYLLGNHHPTKDLSVLRLRDHGSEIISGLCELYATLNYSMPLKKATYEEPIHEMLDLILEIGRNSDGFFYDFIDPQQKIPLTNNLADTWGYILNGYYTVYLIDKTQAYRQAVLKTLLKLEHYKNYNWEHGSMDGYADAIEGALNLYNREADPAVANWLDSEIQILWNYQKENGIIEGWHCDGNFARTSLMYSFWKTKGLLIRPWRHDISWGAVQKGDSLIISLFASNDWKGKLIFDAPRHNLFLNLPLDWPRINQLPEWFTVNPEKNYVLKNVNTKSESIISGKELITGINIDLSENEELLIIVH